MFGLQYVVITEDSRVDILCFKALLLLYYNNIIINNY
jgi:hypothetical protein